MVVQQQTLLHHDAHGAAHDRHLTLGEVVEAVARNAHFAEGGAQNASDHRKRQRFARTRGTVQADELAARHVKRDACGEPLAVDFNAGVDELDKGNVDAVGDHGIA